MKIIKTIIECLMIPFNGWVGYSFRKTLVKRGDVVVGGFWTFDRNFKKAGL